MYTRFFITFALLATSTLADTNTAVTIESIQKSQAYKDAMVAPMTVIPAPPATPRKPTPPLTLTDTDKTRISSRLQKLSISLGVDEQWPFKFKQEPDYITVDAHIGSNRFISFGIDLDDHTIQHMALSYPGGPGTLLDTSDHAAFTVEARRIYTTVLGTAPAGSQTDDSRSQPNTTTGKREGHISWYTQHKGVSFPAEASIRIQEKGPGQWWTWMQRHAPTPDTNKLDAFMKKHPVTVTEEAAMAAAVKSWQKLGTPPDTRARIHAPAIECTKGPTPTAFAEHFVESDRRWILLNLNTRSDTPYGYQITFSPAALWTVTATVDWTTGQVIRMQQGRMSW